MKSTLNGTFDRHTPKICRNIRGKPAPWLNSNAKKLMNDRAKLLCKSRRTKADIDILQCKRKRNKVNIASRKARSSYHKTMLRDNSRYLNTFWKALKSIYPTKSTADPTVHSFDINGVKTNDPYKKAIAFCTFSTTVTVKLRETAIPLPDFVWRKPAVVDQRTNQQFRFRPISKLEVER